MSVRDLRPAVVTNWDRLLVLCLSLVVVDGLMTLPYWQYEGNPVVLALGPVGMMLVKLVGVSGLSAVWFLMDGVRDSSVAKFAVACLTALYAVVVGSNLVYLVVV